MEQSRTSWMTKALIEATLFDHFLGDKTMHTLWQHQLKTSYLLRFSQFPMCPLQVNNFSVFFVSYMLSLHSSHLLCLARVTESESMKYQESKAQCWNLHHKVLCFVAMALVVRDSVICGLIKKEWTIWLY